MTRSLLTVAVCALTAVAATAQTAPDPVRAFRDAVVHKQMYLQNFSAEEDIKATWDGSAILFSRVKYHALAAFVPASVEATPTRLRLNGSLRLVLHDSDKRLLLDGVTLPTKITIELRGPEATATLLKLRDMLFFKNLAEAYRNVPLALRGYVPALNTDEKTRPAVSSLSPCDCADTSAACQGKNSLLNSPGFKKPKLLKTTEADLPPGSIFTSQTTDMVNQVDETGEHTSVWLLKYGDAQTARAAAAATAAYTFTPASCHGQPVPYVIENRYQIN